MLTGQNLIAKGSFTSNGSSQVIALPVEPDFFQIYNLTYFGSAAGTTLMETAYWFNGLTDGYAYIGNKTNGAATIAITSMSTSGGFTFQDTSLQTPGALTSTITAISNASIPVASNSGTNGLSAGDVVRIINTTGAQQLGGLDFTVGYNTLTGGTFSLDYMAQIVAGTTGSWRKINFNPIYYPRRRFITSITSSGTSSIVKLSVTHGYTVGQAVRFNVSSAYGMTEIDQLVGNITAVNTTTTSGNTITVDIDSSGFTAFSFPLTAAVPFTPAQVVPVGEDTAQALSSSVDPLLDATDNQAQYQMLLGSNVIGASNDVIHWFAYKALPIS